MRTKEEIEDELNEAETANGRWPALTYEDGVKAALLWVRGDSDDPPMTGE